jgi:hypothetical protein|uniref:Antirestriction protein n=1 Tax=Phage sp. ctesc4 TaxID=2828008 RepID=A0A8S5TCV3_9VIRU|nr:MAG TPA: hypothetical protein [Phage sp. ctesc4]
MEPIHLADAWDEQRARKAYGWKEWDEYIANFDIADHAALTAYVSQKLRYCDWPPEPLVSPDDFQSLFCGEWNSFEEYVRECVLPDVGISRGAIEWMGDYFDMEQCLTDLSDEYYVAYTDCGTVWVYAVEW